MRIWLYILALLLLSTELKAMSIFDTGKVCTFSSISGVILKDGKPAKNATIKRETDYQSVFTDQTTTDENGYFQMPALFERSLASMLPQQFAVSQYIYVTYEGEEYKIWMGVKFKKEENTESDGSPIQVTCELDSERKSTSVNGQNFITQCAWNVVPTKVDNGFN